LRVPIAAPTSGLHSTVGGAISQGLPGTMEAVLGLTVILADGSRITTGSAALAGRTPFNRHVGPDLTGLFIGDCGAMGIKAEVVLRLVRAPRTEFASFRYDDPLAMVATMVELQRELGLSSMGIDPVRTATALKAVSAAEAVHSATGAAREAGSLRGAVRALVDMARTGADGERQAAGWSLHLTAEHPVEAGARALIDAARALVAEGQPIPPGIPRAARARPFSVRGALGPDAERWVPVHGVVPLSQAVPTMAALLDHVAGLRDRLREAGVFMAWLTTSRHGAVLFEPMLFWPDALTPVHHRYMDASLVARAADRRAPEATRALVAELRRGLCDILDRHGATHLQLGRYYDYAGVLEPGALRLVTALKAALDPQRRINPGQLGLAPDAEP
jgi:FAD/FMN-containing dehydrogenase